MRTRKKYRPFKWIFALFIVAVIIFLGADNFGFDWFNFKIDLSQNSEKEGNENLASGEQKYINIAISNDIITLNEKEVSFEELKETLMIYSNEDYVVNLIDQWALNTPFTQVETYLKEQNYRMIVTETIEEK